MNETLPSLFNKRVIMVLGAGGVGKTTTAAAIACGAAEYGKKVALLSIDPAKRLADAMGIKLGYELTEVAPSLFKGELHACMLDQAAVFDAMVRKFANEAMQKRIFSNRVYAQVSRNLGGPLEYMALAKLGDVFSENYDLIVVDTPPDVHALDFLRRPNILSGFTEAGVMKWLIKPFYIAQKVGMGKLFSLGEKLMGGIATITGVAMLEKISEFLYIMDDVIKGFHASGNQVLELLKSADTSFGVVSSPFPASMRAVENIMQELHNDGFPLDFALLNRITADYTVDSLSSYPEDIKCWIEAYVKKSKQSDLASHHLVKQISKYGYEHCRLVKVAELSDNIEDIDDLCQFSQSIVSSL